MLPTSRGRIAGLDGLRAIAILAVICAHSTEGTVASSAAESRWAFLIGKLGPFGVRLFFAISGYLITSLFVQELATHERSRALRMFYIRRGFRIIPPFLPYLAVMTLGWAYALLPIRGRDILTAGTFLGNYFAGGWLVNHFWSLAVEEQFYLFWPPLIALAGEKASRWYGVAIAGAVAIVRPLTLAHYPAKDASWLLFRTHLIIDFLVYAALLALLLRNSAVRRWLRAQARPAILGGLLGLLMLTDVLSPKVKLVDPRSIEAALFALLAILPSLRPEMALTGWLEHPALVWIGRRSYSIYIWQQLFLMPHGWTLARNLESLIPRAIPIFVVAALSYRFLEEPLIRKGRALAQKLGERRAVLETRSRSSSAIAQTTSS